MRVWGEISDKYKWKTPSYAEGIKSRKSIAWPSCEKPQGKSYWADLNYNNRTVMVRMCVVHGNIRMVKKS